MLSLEDLLVQGLLNKSKVESLIDIYRLCAEYYDSIKDPISLYFTEKIQFTVSHKSILAILARSRTSSGAGEDTLATLRRKEEEEGLKRSALAANDASQRREKKSNSHLKQPLLKKRSSLDLKE